MTTSPKDTCPDCGKLLAVSSIRPHRGNKTCRVTQTIRKHAEQGRHPVPKKWRKALDDLKVPYVEDLALVQATYKAANHKRKELTDTQLYTPLWAWVALMKHGAVSLRLCVERGEEFCKALGTRYLMDGARGARDHLYPLGETP